VAPPKRNRTVIGNSRRAPGAQRRTGVGDTEEHTPTWGKPEGGRLHDGRVQPSELLQIAEVHRPEQQRRPVPPFFWWPRSEAAQCGSVSKQTGLIDPPARVTSGGSDRWGAEGLCTATLHRW
jgi:hypothetical protein